MQKGGVVQQLQSWGGLIAGQGLGCEGNTNPSAGGVTPSPTPQGQWAAPESPQPTALPSSAPVTGFLSAQLLKSSGKLLT